MFYLGVFGSVLCSHLTTMADFAPFALASLLTALLTL